MTIIEQIKAEIERRMKVMLSVEGLVTGVADNMRYQDYKSLLSFLSTLESEKPMEQDELKNEIERFFKDEGWDEYWKWVERPYQLMFGKTVIKFASNFYELGCRRTAEKYDEIEYNRQRAEEQGGAGLEEEIKRYLHSLGVGYGGWVDGMDDDDLRGVARHFAQWGAEHLKH